MVVRVLKKLICEEYYRMKIMVYTCNCLWSTLNSEWPSHLPWHCAGNCIYSKIIENHPLETLDRNTMTFSVNLVSTLLILRTAYTRNPNKTQMVYVKISHTACWESIFLLSEFWIHYMMRSKLTFDLFTKSKTKDI